MKFPEAVRIICERCQESKSHCKSCTVTRIVEEYDTEQYTKRQIALIRSMTIRKYENWFLGNIGDGYSFQVKVTEEDSVWGIDNGRIIKLFITEKPKGENKGDKEIIGYERGWYKYPENNSAHEELIDALCEYFAQHLDGEVL